MNTPNEQEVEKFDDERDMVDRGVLLMPPKPPAAGTFVLTLPPTATWRVRRRAEVTELEVDLGGQA